MSKEELQRLKLLQYAVAVGIALLFFIGVAFEEGLTRATLWVGHTVIGLGVFFLIAVAWMGVNPIDKFHKWRFDRYMTKLKGKDWRNCYGEACLCKQGKPHGLAEPLEEQGISAGSSFDEVEEPNPKCARCGHVSGDHHVNPRTAEITKCRRCACLMFADR